MLRFALRRSLSISKTLELPIVDKSNEWSILSLWQSLLSYTTKHTTPTTVVEHSKISTINSKESILSDHSLDLSDNQHQYRLPDTPPSSSSLKTETKRFVLIAVPKKDSTTPKIYHPTFPSKSPTTITTTHFPTHKTTTTHPPTTATTTSPTLTNNPSSTPITNSSSSFTPSSSPTSHAVSFTTKTSISATTSATNTATDNWWDWAVYATNARTANVRGLREVEVIEVVEQVSQGEKVEEVVEGEEVEEVEIVDNSLPKKGINE